MSVPRPPGPPVQASDPARLSTGQVLPRRAVEMPSGGSFSVDLERAPQTIRELESARDQLAELMVVAVRLGKVDPGTSDEVSRDAASVLGAVATGGQGSLLWALRSGVDRLNLLIDAVRAEIATYRNAEVANRYGFGPSQA
ncbi:hypothetical protein [Actinomycetospora atypica]|uniref:PE domain-containing protein n=1 Tax=Actinomycetospora atypica TaxID=1290095 RepID=A0ABV9YNC9_9PSEU